MQKYLEAVDMELPENLSIAQQSEFNDVIFDFIADAATNEIYVFDEQVGVALEYQSPVVAINDLHDRHIDRIEPYTLEASVFMLRGSKRLKRKTWLYSLHAICEMCRWVSQPRVDSFLDFIWKEVADIKSKRGIPLIRQEEIIDRAAQRITDIIFPSMAKTLSVHLSAQIIEQIQNGTNGGQLNTPKQVLTITEDLPLSALPNTLTVLHIKNYLGIGRPQANDLMHSQGFPSFKLGGSIRVEKRKFIEWLDKKAKENSL